MTSRRVGLGLGAALLMLVSACDSNKITKANDNPNSPTDAPSQALFTNAARNAVGRWQDGVGGTRYGFLSQHLAEAQYPDDDAYSRLRASSTSALFNNSYSNELQDLELIVRRGTAANQPGLSAPAQILKLWEFGVLTDVFGDVPYSQAFKADSLVLSPKYDPQLEIYTDLFAKLTAASSALGGATNQLLGADPIYGGSPAQWRKFANSLRARHALRLINVNPSLANTQLTAALSDAGGLITTNADNAKLAWPGDGIYDSPWANNFKTRDDHRISTRLLTYMRDYSDPRIAAYAQPAEVVLPEIAGRTLNYCPGGTGTTPCYVGIANALTQAQASPLLSNTSRPGVAFYPGATSYGTFGTPTGAKFPSYMLTAAELEFIRAEAAERGIGGLTPGQAAGFYNAGVTRSMEMWGVSAANIATYLANPAVSYTAAATTVDRQKLIAIQKWLALYIDPIQAWSEFRRTCQPAILKPGPSAVVAEIPRRLYYSTNETAVNSQSVAEAVARQGADNFLTHIYWDKSPTAAPTYQTGCGVR
ncbi:MAG: hypothetical protein JWL61_2107 [Gemmatimonadetes bacterium]|nr:hypothetical protein [Gemmatimonadota bacterium]